MPKANWRNSTPYKAAVKVAFAPYTDWKDDVTCFFCGHVCVPEIRTRVSYRARVYNFGEVDLMFINFIRTEIQDYDMANDINFYVVGLYGALED